MKEIKLCNPTRKEPPRSAGPWGFTLASCLYFGLVQRCVNSCDIALAIYARSTPTKLGVGSTTPSLHGRTPDADIKHYITVIYVMLY